MAAPDYPTLGATPLPLRERVVLPRSAEEPGEGGATGLSAYPLIRPFGAPSPAGGEGKVVP
jgi:hypothetical protein